MFLIETMIEPRSRADRQKLERVLPKMAAEDPAFGFGVDQESGQLVLKGIDEEQLGGKIDALRDEHVVGFQVGQPQVAYRETLGRRADIDYIHKKRAGGAGEFARVKITFEPSEPGAGYQFESKVVGGNVPEEYVPGVEKGLALAKENGLLAGFPVIDFTATLTDGDYHDIDSSQRAFEIAAGAAFRELRDKASPKLVEPIMRVEVTTPADCVGDVIGDLESRRGVIDATGARGDAQVIVAKVPLANMIGYRDPLSSLTGGRARFQMVFDGYGPAPDPDPDLFPPAAAMRA